MQLRNRDQLQTTQFYRTTNESAQLQQVEKIKRIRSGKKRSITLRLTQIKRVLDKRGSRTKVTYLRDKLQEELMELLESDYMDIEEYVDVLEVLYTMADYFGVLSIEDIESERLKKLETKGNFIAGVVLNKR